MFDPDEILEKIHRDMEARRGRNILTREATDPCPDCGALLVHQEGITICRNCGYEGPR